MTDHPISFYGYSTADMSRSELQELVHCLWQRLYFQDELWRQKARGLTDAINDNHERTNCRYPWPAFCKPQTGTTATFAHVATQAPQTLREGESNE